jgi:hypothetical protein
MDKKHGRDNVTKEDHKEMQRFPALLVYVKCKTILHLKNHKTGNPIHRHIPLTLVLQESNKY